MKKSTQATRRKTPDKKLGGHLRIHLRNVEDLLEFIIWHAESPAHWPLTPQEQAQFIRAVMAMARDIQKSEDRKLVMAMLAFSNLLGHYEKE